MRSVTRIRPFLARLEAVWEQDPDLRLGQLIVDAVGGDPFYVEDDDLLNLLESFIQGANK